MKSIWRVLWSLLTVAAVAWAPLLPTRTASAHAARSAGAHMEGPSAILGLDSSDTDTALAAELTQALRRAFDERGFINSEELTLAEIRLTMGCEGNAADCLAEAGTSMGVEYLVYGDLKPTQEGRSLSLVVLRVSKGIEEAATTRPLSEVELERDRLDATAREIVASLFPAADDTLEAPPPPPPLVVEAEDQPDASASASKWEWGPYRPRPRGKWAAFGIGATLTAVGAAGALTSFFMLKRVYEPRVQREADRSLDDCVVNGTIQRCSGMEGEVRFTANDVDPDANYDLCAHARETGLDPTNPNAVRNKPVTDACNQGDVTRTLNHVAFGVLAAGGALLITSTILLFVRKKPQSAAFERHELRIGPSAQPDGLGLSGRIRF